MNLKGNLTSKGLQGSIGKSRMQGILGTNPAAIPITVDNALSLSSTNPVQNKVITAAITNRLWSDEVKAALLQIVEKVAYIDDQGQTYYDALYDALYPPVGLDSIGAVFDAGGATIYNTDTLDDLKQYLTVTAYYTSGDSEEVTTYTLSGSMDAGTQTITVSYGGKTTTFTVTVVEWLVSIGAVFTQGSAKIYDTDTLDTLEQYLVVTATYADSTTATVSDYTLSGTLAEGTSIITVGYGGKTDTFSVTVSIGLDSIAFGSQTYRDIFITNNEIVIGDFEGNVTISSTEQTASNGGLYKIQAGTPALTNDYSCSPSHSLKAFGSGSAQIRFRHDDKTFAAGDYICCVSVYVTRYSAGHCGAQFSLPKTSVTETIDVAVDEVTSGFTPAVGILTLPAARLGARFYIGTFLSANADCYVDDVVFAKAPSGITQAELENIYSKYLGIRRAA